MRALMTHCSRTTSRTHAFRWHPLNAALAALALILLAPVAPAGADEYENQPPDLGGCQTLQPPAGNEVASHVYAVGVQIYRWNGAKWAFVSPEAVLFANAEHDSVVGIHFAGPTWESVSGSKTVGVALERCTPDPA